MATLKNISQKRLRETYFLSLNCESFGMDNRKKKKNVIVACAHAPNYIFYIFAPNLREIYLFGKN